MHFQQLARGLPLHFMPEQQESHYTNSGGGAFNPDVGAIQHCTDHQITINGLARGVVKRDSRKNLTTTLADQAQCSTVAQATVLFCAV
jgi:hypothetical protein